MSLVYFVTSPTASNGASPHKPISELPHKKRLIKYLLLLVLFAVPSPLIAQSANDELVSEVHKLYVEFKPSYSEGYLLNKWIPCEGERLPDGGWKVNQNIDRKTGEVWSSDFGPVQINDYWHKAEMKRLDLNIENWKDSLRYGFILLNKVGMKPWKASTECRSR